MKIKNLLIMRLLTPFILFLAASVLCAQDYQALVGATLINPGHARPIENGVILIKGDRIEKVGTAKLKIPTDAKVIDLKGKFIIPGLIDAHVHFFQSGGLYTRPDGIDLRSYFSYEQEQQAIKSGLDRTFARYLRAGITGVADVGGGMWNFEVRERASNNPLAPTVAVAGPLISTVANPKLDIGDPPIVKVASIAQVDSLVDLLAVKKPDFIKIWFIVSPQLNFEDNLKLIQRTIDRSHEKGIRVAVHATQLNTAKQSVRAGADILVHSVDDQDVDQEFIDLLKKHGTIYTSSLAVLEGRTKIVSQSPNPTAADWQIADPEIMNGLLDLQHIPDGVLPDNIKRAMEQWASNPAPNNRLRQALVNLKKLQDAGIPIAAGTDAGNPGAFHASSLYREFQLMKEAGLTSSQILAAATFQGARLMGREKVVGTLEPGKIADLVVLNSNPLADILNTLDISQVMRAGKLMITGEILPATPVEVVERQLLAYNLRDIDAFLATYADEVKIYNHPDQLIMDGKEVMRKNYGGMFQQMEKLHCEIVNRIVTGNKVIDQESVRLGDGRYIKAVAVYEVTGGAITKVWFIR